jgi:hypothetical protein
MDGYGFFLLCLSVYFRIIVSCLGCVIRPFSRHVISRRCIEGFDLYKQGVSFYWVAYG